jgi:predicted Rossmann-fold nucleotide-binding protein
MKEKYSICVAGATDITHLGISVIDSAKHMGEVLASHKNVIIHVPASSGFPFWVAEGASVKHAPIIGFSPASVAKEHKELYKLPTEPFGSLIYTGFGYPGRNIVMVKSSDALIVGPGYIEVFGEFLIALEENKVIGVWEGPWELDEAIRDTIGKKGKHFNVIFDKDPEKLVTRITHILDTQKNK